MEFKWTTLETCHTATGLVVVVDVLRAFTTAAYAFEAGAQNIMLVSTVEEALALRERTPNALVIGEVEGLPVEEFDFNNSPSALVGLDFSQRQIIQRTSAGVQGVVRSTQAETLLVGSLVCAGATVRHIQQHSPDSVTFVITGQIYHLDGDEDAACADYMMALLKGQNPDPAPLIERVYNSTAGRRFADPARLDHPVADLELCVEIDRFDFAMQAKRQAGQLVLEKVISL